MVDQILSEAVIAFIGSVGRLDQNSPEKRVVERIGDQGYDLIPTVRTILASLDIAEPPLFNRASLAAIGEAATEFVRSRYPELAPEAIDAIANAYCFRWK